VGKWRKLGGRDCRFSENSAQLGSGCRVGHQAGACTVPGSEAVWRGLAMVVGLEADCAMLLFYQELWRSFIEGRPG
jgi:hypothetical protein